MPRAVITGLGAVTPLGQTAPETWTAMLAGRSGVGPITAFDASDLPTQIAAEIKGFDPATRMNRKQVRRSSRAAQLSLAASFEALADADLDPSTVESERLGVVINTAFGGGCMMESGTHVLIEKGPRRVSPLLGAMVMPNAVACQTAIAIGARGPVMTSTLACAAGNYAFVEAWHMLQRGEADVLLVGGSDACLSRLFIASMSNSGAMSRWSGEPTASPRPFDTKRHGFVAGEGAAVMLVETEAHAQARGARIYAEILGGALTSSAYHISAPDPDGDGLRRAMQLTLDRYAIVPERVGAVFAHGTGTSLGDPSETKAIRAVFGHHADSLLVPATKSMVGHLLGGAGAVAAMAAVLSMRDGKVPPTLNLDHPDPECDLDYVPLVAREAEIDVALINGSGFGGQNVSLALGRYTG